MNLKVKVFKFSLQKNNVLSSEAKLNEIVNQLRLESLI